MVWMNHSVREREMVDCRNPIRMIHLIHTKLNQHVCLFEIVEWWHSWQRSSRNNDRNFAHDRHRNSSKSNEAKLFNIFVNHSRFVLRKMHIVGNENLWFQSSNSIKRCQWITTEATISQPETVFDSPNETYRTKWKRLAKILYDYYRYL